MAPQPIDRIPTDHATRLWEVDAGRGLAIGLMVAYHVVYDIDLLAPQLGLDPFNGAWRALQVTCGSTFLAIVGASFWIGHARGRRRGLTGMAQWRRQSRRGLEVVAAAALVTVATLVALGTEDYVRFGVLHLIAVAMLVLLPLVARLGRWNALLGVLVIAVGLAIKEVDTDITGALVLGFDPPQSGRDHYPLLPWAGACLLGMAVAAALYPGGERGPLLRRLPEPPRHVAAAMVLGRHSLPFYLVHQPVLIALIAAILTLTGTAIEAP